MNIEDNVKSNLLIRGFDKKAILNNRGLIGATINETILQVVKNLRIADVSGRSELLVDFAKKAFLPAYSPNNPEKCVEEYLKSTNSH